MFILWLLLTLPGFALLVFLVIQFLRRGRGEMEGNKRDGGWRDGERKAGPPGHR